MGEHVVLHLLDAAARDTPEYIAEVEVLAVARRLEKVRLQLLQHTQLVRAEILDNSLQQHLQYHLAAVVLSEVHQVVANVVGFDKTDEVFLDEGKPVGALADTVTTKAMTLEEVPRIDITVLALDTLVAVAVALRDLLPELLIVIERLRENSLTAVDAVAVATEGEFRKNRQLLKVHLRERLYIVKTPQPHELGVLHGGDLVDVDVSPCHHLLRHKVIDVFKQVFLMPLQRVSEEVVDTLVAVMADGMANVNLHVQVVGLKSTHIVLEVLGCMEEVVGALLCSYADAKPLAQVVPVGVEEEHHFLHLALAYEVNDVLREGAIEAKVLNAGNAKGENAVLASFLGFLLSFLDKQTAHLLAVLIGGAQTLGNIDRRARAVGRLVLEAVSLLVLVRLGVLPADTVVLGQHAGTATLIVLALIGDGLALEVVVFNDGIVAFHNLTLVIDSAGAKGASRGLRCSVAKVHGGGDILKGQTTLLQHPLAEGLLARFAHRFGWSLLHFAEVDTIFYSCSSKAFLVSVASDALNKREDVIPLESARLTPPQLTSFRSYSQLCTSADRAAANVGAVLLRQTNVIAKQLKGMRRGRLANLLYNAILNHSALRELLFFR